MEIKQMLLLPNKYTRPCTHRKRTKKLVLHCSDKEGASALDMHGYYLSLAETRSAYSSVHYIIGIDGEVILCVPENEVAFGTGKADANSISIECCNEKADGIINKKTLESLTQLCVLLCKKYRLDPEKDILRHYDVSGSMCMLRWVLHPEEFAAFRQEVKNRLNITKQKNKKK